MKIKIRTNEINEKILLKKANKSLDAIAIFDFPKTNWLSFGFLDASSESLALLDPTKQQANLTCLVFNLRLKTLFYSKPAQFNCDFSFFQHLLTPILKWFFRVAGVTGANKTTGKFDLNDCQFAL